MPQYELPEVFARNEDIDAVHQAFMAQYTKLALVRFNQAVAAVLQDYPEIQTLQVEVESFMDYMETPPYSPYLEYRLDVTIKTKNPEDWVDPAKIEKVLAPFHVEEINLLIHEQVYSQ